MEQIESENYLENYFLQLEKYSKSSEFKLIKACRKNDLSQIMMFVNEGADIHCRDEKPFKSLFENYDQDLNFNLIKLFLEDFNVDPKIVPGVIYTLIINFADNEKNVKILEFLMDYGFEIEDSLIKECVCRNKKYFLSVIIEKLNCMDQVVSCVTSNLSNIDIIKMLHQKDPMFETKFFNQIYKS